MVSSRCLLEFIANLYILVSTIDGSTKLSILHETPSASSYKLDAAMTESGAWSPDEHS